ncbi:YggS family pyridoxal phosphate-dependent enzyme [Candidatus Uhrbacteria bacterium]|nr:YggS family pyridoxal phosphate-dependent enzyme [Candidatus Uhrbacteria bacterium]
MKENWERLRERVGRAASRAGRPVDEIRIMAVTKTHPVQVVRAAVGAGIRLLGENRVQEAESKFVRCVDTAQAAPNVEDRVGLWGQVSLHLIGHLQSNKTRRAVALFDAVQSLDKLATAERLARHAEEAARSLDVMLEVNTSGEPTKFGYEDEGRLMEDMARIAELGPLRVRGLMTIGPFTADETRVRKAFARLRALLERARKQVPDMRELSMGMSSDFETAVEEGATMIRVGTVLFGERPR